MLELPGKARRASVDAEFEIPADALKLAGPRGPMSGIDPSSLPGKVVDDPQAEKIGKWTAGQGLPNYFGYGYLYSGGEDAEAKFVAKAAKSGRHELRMAYGAHENRGASVPVTVSVGGTVVRQLKIDMRQAPPLEAWVDLPWIASMWRLAMRLPSRFRRADAGGLGACGCGAVPSRRVVMFGGARAWWLRIYRGAILAGMRADDPPRGVIVLIHQQHPVAAMRVSPEAVRAHFPFGSWTMCVRCIRGGARCAF